MLFFGKLGNLDNVIDITEQLLDIDKILYLPITKIVQDEELFNIYLNLVDHKTLLNISENNKLLDVEVIKNIFNNTKLTEDKDLDITKYNNIEIEENIKKIKKGQIYENDDINKIKLEALSKYHDNLKDINQNIKQLKKEINDIEEKYDSFKCIEKYKTSEFYKLANYITNCSDYVNKNIDWYKIILNTKKLDKDFNKMVNIFMKTYKLPINYDLIRVYLKKLEDNIMLKNIFRKKILECCKNPKMYYDKITSTVSFEGIENYKNNCKENCLIYLNEDYKDFLKTEINDLDIFNKILILIYCEYRLIFLSKYIILEATRLHNNNTSEVLKIIKKMMKKKKIKKKLN